MALKLLRKEWTLCLHPAALIMLGLSTLTLIPNYPYTVSFFYTTLGLFFIAQGARENHDVTFTLTLPVDKKAVVDGRFLLTLTLELLSLAAVALVVLVRELWLPGVNAAGMDANLALLGEGLLIFGVFNRLFYPAHFKDVNRIGVPFIVSSIAVFVLVTADVVLSYALPFWRDVLDTPDPAHLGSKFLFDLLCLGLYAALTFRALALSRRRFEKQDIH